MDLVRTVRSWFAADARGERGSRRRHAVPRFRPTVEGLEERTVLSTASLAAPMPLGPALVRGHHHAAQVVPLRITGVAEQNGQLAAQGLLGSIPFSAPMTLSTSPNAADPTCPILNLHLGPIHLNVLGLTVDTSEICLSITAESGPGNLLGNLLCNVSHLLDGGTSLGDILGGLTGAQTRTLTRGLTGVLNRAFSRLTAPSAVSGVTGNILHLSLGPVDLNLLGLDVHLDNCHNGPVTIDVGAQPGAGNLLGNLLSGLANLLNGNAGPGAIRHQLARIAHAIDRLL
jgi:hypothetical protein